MKKMFVDTSGWYGLICKDDPVHAAVKTIVKAWQSRLVSTNFILDETLTLVQARLGHALATKVGESLRDPSLVEMVRITAEDEDAAWTLFVKHKDKDFSYTDCSSFAVMRRLIIDTAVTTDRHFEQAGFEIAVP